MPGLLTEASRQDISNAEERLVQELRRRARQQLGGVTSDSDVHIRDLLPSEDLDADDPNNDNGWNGDDRVWEQSGLTAGQLNQVYEIDSNNKAENKIIGIIAVSSVADQIITTEIAFEDGTGSQFERLMVQEMQTFTAGDISLMRNPVIFDEGKDGVIYQYANAAGTDNMIYHGAVAEKAGTSLGTRAPGENSPLGTARSTSQ